MRPPSDLAPVQAQVSTSSHDPGFRASGPESGARSAVLRAVLAASLLALSPGCVVALVGGAVAAVGGAAYVSGELEAGLNQPLQRMWEATLAAVDELEFRIEEQKKDAVYGTVVAFTSTDRRIVIRLERTSAAVTIVRIRVGTFGDEPLSRLILENIQAKAQQLAETATPPETDADESAP